MLVVILLIHHACRITNIEHNIDTGELFRDSEALHPVRHLANNEEDLDHRSNPTRLTIRLPP